MASIHQEFVCDAVQRQMIADTLRLTTETLCSMRSKGRLISETDADEEQVLRLCRGLIDAPEIECIDVWLEELAGMLDGLCSKKPDSRHLLKHQAESIRMVAQSLRSKPPNILED
jgi:hypothetical protein